MTRVASSAEGDREAEVLRLQNREDCQTVLLLAGILDLALVIVFWMECFLVLVPF